MTRSATLVLALILVQPGCSDDGPPGPKTPGADATAGPPVPPSASRCSGSARQCHRFREITSCHKQKNCLWTQKDNSPCTGGHILPCSYYNTESDKQACLEHIGCVWTNADGSQETSLRSGSCGGDAKPCDDYDKQDPCNSQPGCKWSIYDQVCERNDKKRGKLCADFSVIDPLSSPLHVDVAQRWCGLREGCTWQDTTSTPTAGGPAPDGGPAPTPP